MRPMRYTILVSRHGVPHEEWLVEASTPVEAANACDRERLAVCKPGDYLLQDIYDAVPEPDISDDDALAYAYAHAASMMPALLDLLDDGADDSDDLPAWLGADAAPLAIGGAP